MWLMHVHVDVMLIYMLSVCGCAHCCGCVVNCYSILLSSMCCLQCSPQHIIQSFAKVKRVPELVQYLHQVAI